MSVEEDVYTQLAADVSVAALAGNRIRPLQLQQNETLPAIVYERISTVPVNGFDGHHGLDAVRMQVSSWGASLAEAVALAAAVRAAMALAPLYALMVMQIDDYDPEEKIYRVIQDFSIWK